MKLKCYRCNKEFEVGEQPKFCPYCGKLFVCEESIVEGNTLNDECYEGYSKTLKAYRNFKAEYTSYIKSIKNLEQFSEQHPEMAFDLLNQKTYLGKYKGIEEFFFEELEDNLFSYLESEEPKRINNQFHVTLRTAAHDVYSYCLNYANAITEPELRAMFPQSSRSNINRILNLMLQSGQLIRDETHKPYEYTSTDLKLRIKGGE